MYYPILNIEYRMLNIGKHKSLPKFYILTIHTRTWYLIRYYCVIRNICVRWESIFIIVSQEKVATEKTTASLPVWQAFRKEKVTLNWRSGNKRTIEPHLMANNRCYCVHHFSAVQSSLLFFRIQSTTGTLYYVKIIVWLSFSFDLKYLRFPKKKKKKKSEE